ncbi:methyltransferase-like protein 27 [Centroberyx affinis]|uniref:methyltransferase-like protein 27 n=1 Tax=Centroberyx affinis TaxID=166261 RepID=UPI003A5BE8FE
MGESSVRAGGGIHTWLCLPLQDTAAVAQGATISPTKVDAIMPATRTFEIVKDAAGDKIAFYNSWAENYDQVDAIMAATRTLEIVKDLFVSVHKDASVGDKIAFYNSWAENYDQDAVILDFSAPIQAVNRLTSNFTGDREAAVVLDVACGTGMVAKQMKTHGFGHFVGIDGSEGMMELARKTGLYQDLRQCIMGVEPLPVQWGSFDVVVITGALSLGHVPVPVVRELCKAAKPGGYICMTTRLDDENAEYKAALESELKRMEDEGLWRRVEVTEVKEWEKAVNEHEEGYITGFVYLYKTI